MTARHVDILISGGGPAGLIAAACLGAAGARILLVDPGTPVTERDAEGADLRSTAFLQPARTLFEESGLWPDLAPHATPLEALRVVDTAGSPPDIRAVREFRATDIGDQPFGWNLPNWLIRKVLVEHLSTLPGVETRFGVGFADMLTRSREAVVRLTDGSRVVARLVVGADGRNSPVRGAAGIGVETTRYGQKALAFAVTHPEPHGNVSTEIYHEGGPFTMVPLPDHRGAPSSAIVWMNDGPRAVDLAAMEVDAFEAEMTARACAWHGPLTLASRRNVWPIVTQRATAMTARRTALIAEAAHVMPPIGAQGLNTSVNDIAALLAAWKADPDAGGSPAMLDRYADARGRDVAARLGAIDLFNRVTRRGDGVTQALRLAGLRAVHDLAPVRRRVMRAGMGPAA